MGTKALSVVVATIVALSMVDMAAAVTFDWWNASWHYRVNVTINTSVYNRTDWPIEQGINFTALGVAGAFDNNSVRVIEYNGTTGAVMSEIMSQFDGGENYDKDTNAYGEVVWLLNGTRPESTMLYYYIYFDSEDAGVKSPANYTSTLKFYSFSDGNSLAFGLNNSKIAIRVDTDRGTNYTSGMYFANVSGTVIFDSPSGQDPIEYIQYKSGANYYGYNFTDNFEVVSEGPIRIKVRQNGSEKDWGSVATLTGDGYMTKTYTIYKNSQWITIKQTFTSTSGSGLGRTSDAAQALAMDVNRTSINPNGFAYNDLLPADPYSWASVAKNSMGLGVINLEESISEYYAYREIFIHDFGITLEIGFTIDPGQSISELAAVYFNNDTSNSHYPVEALRNRSKDNVNITMGPLDERRTVVQAQTNYGAYNRNETINITGNVTLDTHNLTDHANATLTDPTGTNTSINLTKSGSLFLGNYTLPLNAINGTWNLTVRVYDENDYLLNTSVVTFNVSDVYIVDILVLTSPGLVNQTMRANVSVRTFRNDAGILGANLSCAYYNSTNVTDVTDVTNITDNGLGNYSLNWTAPEEGSWNLTCNATRYNNTGTGNATFTTTVKDTTLLNMTLTTTQYNVSGVTQTAYKNVTMRFNVTNLDLAYAFAVNVTLNTSGWPINITANETNPYSCGDIGPFGSCIVDFNVTVPEQTTPGMYNITANVTWRNYNGTTNSSFDWINITVDSNPSLEIMQPSLNRTFAENTGGLLGVFTVNSTGNEDLGFVDFSCISGDVCDYFNPVFDPENLSSLTAGSWENVSVNITIPDGYPNGSYNGTVNASYGGAWDTVILNVTVPVSKNWSAANVSSCDKTVLPNDTGDICEFEINNTGNVDLYFNITPATNASSFVNYTYSNETNFTVDANTTRRILFRYNTTGAPNQTNITTYNINATDPLAEPGNASLNVTLEVVLGPDIEFFNVTPAKLPQLDNVTINVTLTDRLGQGISWVNANITRPDGSVVTVNLTNDTVLTLGGTSNWSYTNNTYIIQRGTNYSVVVFSWDDGGGYVESTEKNFTVYAKLNIDIYPGALSIEQGSSSRFFIYVNDSNNAPLQGVNVTIEITSQVAWGPYSYSTDSNGYKASDSYTILETDPTGQWDWNATVTYYDPMADENITENVSGQFSVLPEGATYTVSVSAGDQYYPGDNVTIIATAYESGSLLTQYNKINITVNITDDSGNEVKVWNLTRLPGDVYKGILELPANFTSGMYFAKAVLYYELLLPDTRSNIDVFEVLPYTPQLTLDVSVGDIYKPGALVSITAFVNDQNNQYLPDANVTIRITDPNGTAVDLNMTAVNSTTPPKYTANYTLSNNASLGPYIVFSEANYDSGYASDVDIFTVSESLYAKVAIGPVVYLNATMDISITVLNPITSQGIDPDEITLLLYSTENNTLQLWKNLTKTDFTAGDPGLYNYSETVDSNTSTGSYIALLQITEGSYRAWGMETFSIETGLFYDVQIVNVTDPLTKGGDLGFTVNITNMGEFLSEDVVVNYWIDDGTVYSYSEPIAISPTGESKIYGQSFSGVNLPAGTHILYVSVSYDNVPIATASKTFQIADGGGGPGAPAGGGGGGPAAPKGIPKLSIIEFYPPEVHVERGGTTYLVVTVENLGGADLHDVSAHITGIPEEWSEVIKGEALVLKSGEGSDILLQIKIPENITAQTVTLTVTATSSEMSYEKSIILRIFSSRYDLVYFEIESVKKTMRNSEDRAFRALKEGKNVSMAMAKLDEARVEIRQAESFLGNHEYTKALGRLDNAREVLEHVNELLELARVEAAPPAPAETPAPRAGISMPVLVFILLVIAALAGAVVYLTRERISATLKPIGMPTLKRPKFKKLKPEIMAKSQQLKEDTRKVERLLETMRDQHDKGLLSDNTYKELKKRNETKLREIHSQLRGLGA